VPAHLPPLTYFSSDAAITAQALLLHPTRCARALRHTVSTWLDCSAWQLTSCVRARALGLQNGIMEKVLTVREAMMRAFDEFKVRSSQAGRWQRRSAGAGGPGLALPWRPGVPVGLRGLQDTSCTGAPPAHLFEAGGMADVNVTALSRAQAAGMHCILASGNVAVQVLGCACWTLPPCQLSW
jgi:hypothetical protein